MSAKARRDVILKHHHDLSESFHQWVLLGVKPAADPIGTDRLPESWFAAVEELGSQSYRNVIGRGKGHYRWLTVRCNNSACPGLAIVSENWLLGMITNALPVPPYPHRIAPPFELASDNV